MLSSSWDAFGTYRERALGKQITQFAKEIIKSTPSTDMESWERVAVNFSSYMYENKFWNTEYFFFDGSSCHVIFRRTLLWLSAAMDNDSKLNFFRKHPYIEEALKVYFAEVDRKWNLIKSQKSSSNIPIGNIQLPGQSYHFKFFQFFKTIKERISIATTIIACVMSIWSSKFLILPTFWIVFGCFFKFLFFEIDRSHSMEVEHKLQYLSTIISEQKNSDGNVWDKIAKRMNAYLLERKVWGSDVFFFDGADCEHFFERNFLRHLPSRASSRPELPIAELLPYIEKAQTACGGDQLL